MPEDSSDALVVEALRIHERFSIEFVECLGFCPWAKKARLDGKTRSIVLVDLGEDPAAETPKILSAMRTLSEDEGTEVAFVLFPLLALGRKEFERLVAALREKYAEAYDGSPPMALAAFHPAAPYDDSSPARALPFVRRSPDPTIQMVRRSVLDAVRNPSDSGTGFVDLEKVDFGAMMSGGPPKAPLHQRVAEANMETLRAEGQARLEGILEDICRDRDRSYGRIQNAIPT